MIRYLVRRLIWAVVLFFAVTIVTYFLFFIIPANPADLVCGQACRAGDVARIKHNLGLDRRGGRDPLDPDRRPGWDPVRVTAENPARQGLDELRPDRDLCAPDLDR